MLVSYLCVYIARLLYVLHVRNMSNHINARGKYATTLFATKKAATYAMQPCLVPYKWRRKLCNLAVDNIRYNPTSKAMESCSIHYKYMHSQVGGSVIVRQSPSQIIFFVSTASSCYKITKSLYHQRLHIIPRLLASSEVCCIDVCTNNFFKMSIACCVTFLYVSVQYFVSS